MKRVSRLFAVIGAGALFVMMCLTVSDVVARYLLRRTFAGAPEIAEFLMVFVIFLGWAFCAVRRAHVSVSLLVEKFSQKAQRGLDFSMLCLSLFVYLVMAWRMSLEALHQRSISTVLKIPKAPFYGVMAAGVALFCLAIFKLILDDLKEMKGERG